MNGLVGYTLVLLSAIATLAALFAFGELLLIILIFCPLKNCIPQFLILLIVGFAVFYILFWLMRFGIKVANKSSGN